MTDDGLELETLHEQAEYALDVTNSIIWAVDLDTGETETLYGPVESLFNVRADDVGDAASFFENAVHPDDLPEVEHVYVEVLRGLTERFEVEFRTHPDNGSVRWIEAHAQVQSDEETRQLVGTSTDITDRKRHERELERQNERLEEFARVVSQDLRTPLQVAVGRLALVREEHESEHLDAVARVLDRMETLIEDLLARAEDGKPFTSGEGAPPEVESVELATVVETCWQTVETNGATLVIETDQVIHADRHRLQRLLETLIWNAVDHGGHDVTVTVGDLDDGTGFYVADDGPGIPESDRETLFETGSSPTAAGGGLGGHVVEEIEEVVHAHGWAIAVTDSDDGGARFEVTGITTE